MSGYKFDYEKKVWGGEMLRLSPIYLRASRLFFALKDIKNENGKLLDIGCGAGDFIEAFSYYLPKYELIGIDISPEHPDIVEKDFFTYTPSPHLQNILVIGNPPFGRSCSLAIKFFNHASKWANVIAFIIPRTFRRVSIHNKLNVYFHQRMTLFLSRSFYSLRNKLQ